MHRNPVQKRFEWSSGEDSGKNIPRRSEAKQWLGRKLSIYIHQLIGRLHSPKIVWSRAISSNDNNLGRSISDNLFTKAKMETHMATKTTANFFPVRMVEPDTGAFSLAISSRPGDGLRWGEGGSVTSEDGRGCWVIDGDRDIVGYEVT